MGRRGSGYTSSSSSGTSSLHHHQDRDLTTDLRLGLSLSASEPANPSNSVPSEEGRPPVKALIKKRSPGDQENECNSGATFFVKVYMEGIPIGRKLDLLAHDGYQDLIITLDHMFNTNILWAEMECENFEQSHVLTYEDREGDWLIVGDVPWEMFLSSVRRLKITRAEI